HGDPLFDCRRDPRRRVRKAFALEDFREQAGDRSPEPYADDPHRPDATGSPATGAQAGASPRALRLEAVWRLCADSWILRRRMSDGVTSTHSSSRMYSSAWSSESPRGGISRTVESADGARVLVSFFSFVALTSRS